MRSRHLSLTLLFASFLLLFTIEARAQVIPISGKITLKQPDGSVVPVAGAIVDIYRTDVKQNFQAISDSTGAYKVTLVYIGTYTISVSARGAKPEFRTGVRLMRQPTHDFTLVRGDGSRLTLEQISAGAATASESPKSSDVERKTSEVEEQNRKITQSNEAVLKAFNAGNAALNANQLDEAIARYREGLAVRADEPALLTNLAEALQRRGVASFNSSVKASNSSTSEGTRNAAKRDWLEAAKLSRKALDVLSGQPPGPSDLPAYVKNKQTAMEVYARAMRLVATKVDQTQASTAWEAYSAYIAIQIDPAFKTKLRNEALEMLFDAGATDEAVARARKIVATEPNDLVANRILGLSLFASNIKTNFQEAADHLQTYLDFAPDSDPLKSSVQESLEYLKSVENITPKKRRANSKSGRP